MPTRVLFTSGEKLILAESFDQVNQQLGQQTAGLFTRDDDASTRVTVFASGISYIEELTGEEATGGLV